MKYEEDESNNEDDNDCPPIKIDMHQNSYIPRNIKKRGGNENE